MCRIGRRCSIRPSCSRAGLRAARERGCLPRPHCPEGFARQRFRPAGPGCTVLPGRDHQPTASGSPLGAPAGRDLHTSKFVPRGVRFAATDELPPRCVLAPCHGSSGTLRNARASAPTVEGSVRQEQGHPTDDSAAHLPDAGKSGTRGFWCALAGRSATTAGGTVARWSPHLIASVAAP